MNMKWVAFDLETTGIQPGSRIVEIAAVLFDSTGLILNVFEEIVDPAMPVPPDATRVHGLGDPHVAGKPTTHSMLQRFSAWLPAQSVVMAHNAPYDLGILHWEYQRAGLPTPSFAMIDTLALARQREPGGAHDLGTMMRRLELSMKGEAHRAMPDADAVRQLFLAMSKNNPPEPQPWNPSHQYSDRLPEALRSLPEHVQKGSPFSFAYTDKRGRTYHKTMTPYGWAMVGDRLRFHGLCHFTRARRMFAAEGVQEDMRTLLPQIPMS